MRVDLTSLTREDVIFWNSRWSAGSTSNTQELLRDLKFCIREEMVSDLQINNKRLGHWLRKNGWTPTRGFGSKRQWKQNQPCESTVATHGGDTNRSTTQGTDKTLAKHRSWYIDFRKDRVQFSQLAMAKNVIFVDRGESEPSVYWEFGRFIKILNADNEKVHMSVWWQTHRPRYEKMQDEFEFHPLTLLPCRRSLARRQGIIKKTDSTEETLMATKGLLAMLLHWTTNCSMTRTRRAAAKAMLNDVLHQALSAIDDTDEIWHSFTKLIIENKLDGQLNQKPSSMTRRDKGNVKGTSLYDLIANSCIYLFSNRQKCQDLNACLVKLLRILETKINELILTGKVGQGTGFHEEKSMTLEEEDQSAALQKRASSPLESKVEQGTGLHEEQSMKLEEEGHHAALQKCMSSPLESKSRRTNVASAHVSTRDSGSHGNVTQMMKLERVFKRKATQTNRVNKKRKHVKSPSYEA